MCASTSCVVPQTCQTTSIPASLENSHSVDAVIWGLGPQGRVWLQHTWQPSTLTLVERNMNVKSHHCVKAFVSTLPQLVSQSALAKLSVWSALGCAYVCTLGRLVTVCTQVRVRTQESGLHKSVLQLALQVCLTGARPQ